MTQTLEANARDAAIDIATLAVFADFVPYALAAALGTPAGAGAAAPHFDAAALANLPVRETAIARPAPLPA